MKKLILFLAFLLPLGLMAKCPDYVDQCHATQDFKMNVTKPKKETIQINKGNRIELTAV